MIATLTNKPQFIYENGHPKYAVISYSDFSKAFEPDRSKNVPHEVVELAVKHDWNMVKAWRLHLSLSQATMATRMGITQSAFSQIENGNPESSTLHSVAKAMGIEIEQLDGDEEW